jgi:hypothetical protein
MKSSDFLWYGVGCIITGVVGLMAGMAVPSPLRAPVPRPIEMELVAYKDDQLVYRFYDPMYRNYVWVAVGNVSHHQITATVKKLNLENEDTAGK